MASVRSKCRRVPAVELASAPVAQGVANFEHAHILGRTHLAGLYPGRLVIAASSRPHHRKQADRVRPVHRLLWASTEA